MAVSPSIMDLCSVYVSFEMSLTYSGAKSSSSSLETGSGTCFVLEGGFIVVTLEETRFFEEEADFWGFEA